MRNKVLIIDDESITLSVMKKALEGEPYDVICANSGKDALSILEKEEFTLIIADEMMPGMTGTELFAITKKKYPDTFRIILTGYANLESALTAINTGEVYRFLTKPCNFEDLKITVRHAIDHRELKRENDILIRKIKDQSKTIENLENKQPGITKVKRDSNGAVII
ncbi:MAG: response regulator [Deltaproteobacteria bacterium]|nr:response regulator [Deltaproteobacteria bacterium]